MVKLLFICGSARRASTAYVIKEAAAAAREIPDVEVDEVYLAGKKINPCIHCNKCVREGSDRCSVYTDDMTPLYDKVWEADGLLIMCPVYDMNITPQLAAFFSRFRSAWMLSAKDPYFFMKKIGAAMAVGGTRNGGQEGVIHNIHNWYSTHGILVCTGGGSVYAGASFWNPGDGSTTMDDPIGMENARNLGAKLAVVTKALKTGTWDRLPMNFEE